MMMLRVVQKEILIKNKFSKPIQSLFLTLPFLFNNEKIWIAKRLQKR